MILQLSSKATFGRNVAPVDLAGDDTNDDTNDDTSSLPSSCSTAGWGIVTWESKHSSRVLMEANVTLIVDELCPQEVSYCSGGKTGPADVRTFKEYGKDFIRWNDTVHYQSSHYTVHLQGDSGGPLICEGEKAFGVVSAGRETTPGYVIHKYTKISAYRSWINVIMNITGKPWRRFNVGSQFSACIKRQNTSLFYWNDFNRHKSGLAALQRSPVKMSFFDFWMLCLYFSFLFDVTYTTL